MTTEQAWGIMNHKYSLKECMEILGLTKEESNKAIEQLKESDKNDCSNFFVSSYYCTLLAYYHLVKEGELPADKIFNLASNKITETGWVGDIGLMGQNQYRYMEDKWVQF